MKILKSLCLILFVILWQSSLSYAAIPVTTDNRIKTYVYNENEVFLVVLNYGYQSSIQFSKNEDIETISLGDAYAWKITPVGTRIFIKPLEENIHTNMTVITTKRTYHFDLASKPISQKEADKDLSYVVKFYYPEPKKKLIINEDELEDHVEYNYDYSLN